MATESLRPYLLGAEIWPNAVHSDHCPSVLDIDFNSNNFKNRAKSRKLIFWPLKI